MNRSRMRLTCGVTVLGLSLLYQSSSALVAPDYVFTGPIDSRMGTSVTAADINNDNHADIIVGLPMSTPLQVPAIRAYSGATGLLLVDKSYFAGSGFGNSVAGGIDLNKDGFEDVIAGTPFIDTAGADRGMAFVYQGPSLVTTIRVMMGANPGDHFGWSVDNAGDVNYDTYDDIIVGSPFSDSFAVDAGLVAVYSGNTGSLLRIHGGSANDQLGWAVHGAGYVNVDSNFDYAAGAPYDGDAGDSAGKVIVYSGFNGTTIHTFLGAAAFNLFGFAFAAGGDYGNVGFAGADLLIGAPLSSFAWPNGGSVRLYYGETGVGGFGSGWCCQTGWYGSAVVWANDLNLNGEDEMFVGARYMDVIGVDAGMVTGPGFVASGEFAGDQFGYSIATADVSGDGLDDLIVGAPGYPAGADSGRVYVYIMKDNDSDLVIDPLDNCPFTYNPGQEDTDADSIGNACEVDDTLVFTLLSPVDMVVTDPAGDSMGIGFNTIQQGSAYDTLSDVNNDLETDDQVTIPNPIAGPYNVRIIAEPGANPNDQFTLTIRINGNQLYLPEDYSAQTVSALGSTIPDTYVWNASTTLPGDANANGVTNAADIIFLVNHVFKSGPGTPVTGHGDVNCDGVVTSADIIGLVNYVFKSGTAPCSNSAGG